MKKETSKPKSAQLKGWNEIAEFLGQTASVAQRWQKEGMPVTRDGRSVYASPEELTAWAGTKHGQKDPIHIASEDEDLLGDLEQGCRMSGSSRRSEAPESDRMKKIVRKVHHSAGSASEVKPQPQ